MCSCISVHEYILGCCQEHLRKNKQHWVLDDKHEIVFHASFLKYVNKDSMLRLYQYVGK